MGRSPYDGSMERNRRGRPRHPDVLTPAEWRVLDALREGGTNAEIAARLDLSADTVKTHISNMLAKLELRDRRALAAWRPDTPRRRLAGVLAVPAVVWSVGRPLAWAGVGAAALAGVVVVVVALVALEGIVEGDPAPPAARPPPPTTSTPAAPPSAPGSCAAPTAPSCIRAVHIGAPGDYAKVVDIPADLLLTPGASGQYHVEPGVQYTVVTAARLPEGWTRFWLDRVPSGTPSPVSAAQLIQPIGTTYTFTVSEDPDAPARFTYNLTAAKPHPVRPTLEPVLGDVVVRTVFQLPTFTYNQFDSTGTATRAGSYAFLMPDGDSEVQGATTAVTTYEQLREESSLLRVSLTDADGASQTRRLRQIMPGDIIEWHQSTDCFVRYTVGEVAVGAARMDLAVEWMTYAFTGCSGAVNASAPVSLKFGSLPNLGGFSLTAPLVHGSYQIVPADWTGTIEEPIQLPWVPRNWPEYRYREPAIENPAPEDAQALPNWRTPTIPADWELAFIQYDTPTTFPFGYSALWETPEGYYALIIEGYYRPVLRSAFRTPSSSPGVMETRVVDGRPALVLYSPPGPHHSPTYPIRVWIYDPATQAGYKIEGFHDIDQAIAIVESLFPSD